VEGGGAARQGDRVSDADPLGELGLECVDVRSERRDPVGVERLEQHLALEGTDLGW